MSGAQVNRENQATTPTPSGQPIMPHHSEAPGSPLPWHARECDGNMTVRAADGYDVCWLRLPVGSGGPLDRYHETASQQRVADDAKYLAFAATHFRQVRDRTRDCLAVFDDFRRRINEARDRAGSRDEPYIESLLEFLRPLYATMSHLRSAIEACRAPTKES